MSYENVLVEKRDQIGFITLNRPQAMNTFNVPFARELNDALWEMERDPEVRVVVIDANGKNFSTGISLDEFKGKTNKEYREFIHLMDEHNHTIAKMKKPVIASVNGFAVGGGQDLIALIGEVHHKQVEQIRIVVGDEDALLRVGHSFSAWKFVPLVPRDSSRLSLYW